MSLHLTRELGLAFCVEIATVLFWHGTTTGEAHNQPRDAEGLFSLCQEFTWDLLWTYSVGKEMNESYEGVHDGACINMSSGSQDRIRLDTASMPKREN